jgi:hypothetical protein
MKYLKNLHIEHILFILFFIFSWVLMWQTFRTENGTIIMATKVWSDFGATLPLERSFAYGSNFPPEYPLFAGPPIRYHFVFFMLVGLLERGGVPLDWALNSLSILGFFALLICIYLLGKKVFQSVFVGTLSVILFLFNGSWGFLEFFQKHPISTNTFRDIFTNETFSSFGPYDGKVVSAFWSLNIFTNQRHLAIGYAAFLGLLYFLYASNRKEKSNLSYPVALVVGILVGIFPFIHLTVYMMMCISLLVCFLIFQNIRKQIFLIGVIAGIVGIPQIFLMGQSMREVELFHPGYLVRELTVVNFFSYWFLNLGILTFLAPIGFILAKKRERKVLLPFLVFFVIGNLFQFSPEMASNHKFFNLFVIGANIFVAYALYRLWKFNLAGKLLVPLLIILVTLTGIIDIFPIFNDGRMVIDDIPNNKSAQYIVEHTPPDSVFLNAQFINDPASLAGRKIYLGWPYFSWSAGYDTDSRFKTMQTLFSPVNSDTFCKSATSENIDYVEIQTPQPIEDVSIDYNFFEQHPKRFFDSKTNISIYSVDDICRI